MHRKVGKSFWGFRYPVFRAVGPISSVRWREGMELMFMLGWLAPEYKHEINMIQEATKCVT
jgi:hypothetical protein